MSLTAKVLVGMALGIIVGLAINILGLNAEGGFIHTFITNGAFAVVGKMFVNALKMLVVPLVLLSLIGGVCGIGDIRLLGVAIGAAVLTGIGSGMEAESATTFKGAEAPPLSEVLINIIPSNPVCQ